jgi:S-formylglutathione hydrolase FrmB
VPSAHAGSSVAVWGHSQGGHAALWANQLAPIYAPELHLLGSVPIAPASVVFALYQLRQAFHDDTWGYLVMFLTGLHASYPSVDLNRVFTPAGMAKLGVVDTGCESAVNDAYRGHDGTYWFRLDPVTDPVFGPLMRAQEPGQVRMAAPLLMAQGLADTTVPPGATSALAANLCAMGQRLQYRTYPGLDHDSVTGPAFAAALTWTRARLAGDPAPDTCPPAPPVTSTSTTAPVPSVPAGDDAATDTASAATPVAGTSSFTG